MRCKNCNGYRGWGNDWNYEKREYNEFAKCLVCKGEGELTIDQNDAYWIEVFRRYNKKLPPLPDYEGEPDRKWNHIAAYLYYHPLETHISETAIKKLNCGNKIINNISEKNADKEDKQKEKTRWSLLEID